MMKTGVRYFYRGSLCDLYYNPTAKHPLSTLFVYVGDKKEKISPQTLGEERIQNIVKTLKIETPAGKEMSASGRFITPKETKTFTDPITFEKMNKKDGIEFDTKWYAKESLRKWLRTGNDTVPHTRRQMTMLEEKGVFTNNDGTVDPGYGYNYLNDDSDSDNDSEEVLDLAEVMDVYTQPITIASFEYFTDFVEEVFFYMRDNDYGGLRNVCITIPTLPTFVLNVYRYALVDGDDASYDVYIDVAGREYLRTNVEPGDEETGVMMEEIRQDLVNMGFRI